MNPPGYRGDEAESDPGDREERSPRRHHSRRHHGHKKSNKDRDRDRDRRHK